MAEEGPLAGIRVLDLTTMLVGPYATQIMSDLGADVIKVESPSGDPMRYVGPMRHQGMGGIYLGANKGKRSIVVDLKNTDGQYLLLEMAKKCTVLVHNMRTEAASRLHIDYASVSRCNPSIIYCDITGYGAGGPYSDRPAYDDTIQGVSGMAYLESHIAGEPRYSPSDVADKVGGLYAAIGMLTALFERERTGRGRKIVVPMFESMVSFVLMEHLYGATFRPALSKPEYERTVSNVRKPYRTLDGFISMAVYTDQHWSKFFDLIGRAELKTDSRFVDLSARSRHYDELYAVVEESLRTKTTHEWLEIFTVADIPSMPVNSTEQLLTDPHLQAIRLFDEVRHPTEGPILAVRSPLAMSFYPNATSGVAHRLGENTREVLIEFGYSLAEINNFVSRGAVKEFVTGDRESGREEITT